MQDGTVAAADSTITAGADEEMSNGTSSGVCVWLSHTEAASPAALVTFPQHPGGR